VIIAPQISFNDVLFAVTAMSFCFSLYVLLSGHSQS